MKDNKNLNELLFCAKKLVQSAEQIGCYAENELKSNTRMADEMIKLLKADSSKINTRIENLEKQFLYKKL